MTSQHTIVFIDDDPVISDFYRTELVAQKIGTVEMLHDPAELVTDEQIKSRLKNASIVVLDIMMGVPEGMPEDGTEGGLFTGCKIHKSIQVNFPNLPIICLTNLSPSHVDAAAKQLGVPSATVICKLDMQPAQFANFLSSHLPNLP